MSSRNQYLSPTDRPLAAVIHGTLQALRGSILAGMPVALAEDEAAAALAAAGLLVDYAVVRRRDLSEPTGDVTGPLVALVAARLGSTRLIDNLEFEG